MQIKVSKESLLYAFLSFFIVLIVCLLHINPYTKKFSQRIPPFLAENSQKIDSLILKMDTLALIHQLIVVQEDITDEFQLKESGAVLNQSLLAQNEIKNASFSKNLLPPFVIYLPDTIQKDSIKNSFILTESTLASIKSDTLFHNYLQFCLSNFKNKGIQYSSLDFFSKIASDNFDSIQMADYIKRSSHCIELFEELGLLSSMEFFYQYETVKQSDTTQLRKIKEIQNLQIHSAVSSIVLDMKHLESIKSSNISLYPGLKILKNLANIEMLSKISDFDMIITQYPLNEISQKIFIHLKKGKIKLSDIQRKVRKILLAKQWLGKNKISKPLPTFQEDSLITACVTSSLILVNDRDTIFPLRNIEQNHSIFIISNENFDDFKLQMQYYKQFPIIQYTTETKDFDEKILSWRKVANPIIIFDSRHIPASVSDSLALDLRLLSNSTNSIVYHIGSLENLQKLAKIPCLIQVHNLTPLEEKLIAQSLWGGIEIQGRLPQKLDEKHGFASGLKRKKMRLSYLPPAYCGVKKQFIQNVDSIILDAIQRGSFPGCQVFIAKKGNVILNKSYGKIQYNGKAVQWDDVYDLASVTKIAATTLASMKMIDLGKMSLNQPLKNYFKNTTIDYTKIDPDTFVQRDTLYIREVKNMQKLLKTCDTINLNDSMFLAIDTIISKLTPKNNIFQVQIEDLLRHQSGIQPVFPILPYMLYKTNPDRKNFRIKPSQLLKALDSLSSGQAAKGNVFEKYYSSSKSDSSRVEIARNMYLRNKYFDTLWIESKQLQVYSKKVFVYSDVNMVLLQFAIDTMNKIGIDKFMERTFYKPLGLKSICYKPVGKISKEKIAPTEYDKIWRNQVLQGYVHDPTAALWGGVAGNAGVFSNAHDLGVLYQMVLNQGEYGGTKYLSPGIIKKFASRQPESDRGLGFDMKSKKQKIAASAPMSTFGHTGYTGTCIWVDPENEIVMVFLSNRCHPSSKNWKMVNLKVREKIQQAVYDAM